MKVDLEKASSSRGRSLKTAAAALLMLIVVGGFILLLGGGAISLTYEFLRKLVIPRTYWTEQVQIVEARIKNKSESLNRCLGFPQFPGRVA